MSLGNIFTTLLHGAGVTVEVWVFSALLALPVAFASGLGRLSSSRLVRSIVAIYIEIFRGTSALVQLFFLYFVMPFFGLSVGAVLAGVLALGLNEASYGADLVRAGVQAVPVGQKEAATVLGIDGWTRFRRVVLPQALVLMLPPLSNLAIDLLKLTSIVSLITLSDMTFQAQQLRLGTGSPIEIFVVLMLMYYVMSTAIVWGFRWLERRGRRWLAPATERVARSAAASTGMVEA